MAASEFGDHVHRSPAQRHRANRERALNRQKRERGIRAKRQQERDQ